MKKLVFFLSFISSFAFGQSGLDSLRLVVPVGHTSDIISAVFNSDGKLILTSSENGTYKILEARTGKELFQLKNDKEIVTFANFCPDGKSIVVVTNDTLVYMLNLKNQNKTILIKETQKIESVYISPDTKSLIYLRSSGQACLYSLVDKKLKKVITEKNWIENVKFSPNGELFLTSNEDDRVSIYDTKKEKLLKSFKNHDNFITDLDFSLDGNFFLSASADGTLILYNIEKDYAIEEIIKFKFSVYSAKFCSNTKITIYLEDGSMILHDIYRKENIVLNTESEFKKVFINGNFITSIDKDKNVIIRNFSNDNAISFNSKHALKFTEICQNNNFLLMVFQNNELLVLDLKKGNFLKTEKSISLSGVILHFEKKLDIYKILSEDKLIRHIDFKNGNFVRDKKDIKFSSLDFSSINIKENLVIVHRDNKFSVWNLESNTEIYNVDGHENGVISVIFSNNGQLLASIGNDNKSIIRDSKSGKILNYLKGHDFERQIHQIPTPEIISKEEELEMKKNKLNSVCFSNDDKLMITTGDDNKAIIWDVETGNLLHKLYGHKSAVIYACFSIDRKLAITASFDKTAIIWDVRTGKILSTLKDNLSSLSFAGFSQDSKNAITLSFSGQLVIYDILSNKIKFKLSNNNPVMFYELNQERNFLVSTHQDFSIGVYDIERNQELYNVKGHSDLVSDIIFSSDGTNFLSKGKDNKTILWDTKSGKPLYELIILENNNYFIQLPNSPYYMCSKDASKMLHYVTPSLKVIGFEQLDPIYNRPDIVLDSIGRYFGNNDRGMIEEYRKAWEKRIERLGLKDQMDKLGKGEISVPNAEIQNTESIAYENSEGTVSIVVKANDPKYKLRRFNVWVNEVPVYGSSGISIAGLNKNEWDTTLSVPLSLGENKIQVSVMNELGLENFKYPLYVKYNSEKVVPKTHFIGIGVDKFDNGMDLSYCVKDIKDLGDYFSKLPNSSLKLLTDKEVNKENIAKLKAYLKTTSVHDRVIISCSSHGILDSARNFYLATHDTDFNKPEFNGISYEMLDGLLDDIPARKKLLLLDACNSGENDEGFAKMDNSYIKDTKGANVKIGDEIVKESNFKKMKELFVNVRNNSGAYIISATGGIQKALEGEAVMLDGKPLENGSFTYAVLEYLKENESSTSKLTVNQLKKYVEQRVVEITNGKQTPTSRQETMEIDWDLK